MKDYGVNTGLRLSKPQFEKAKRLASNLGISRNKLIGLLVDSAEVETIPSISIRKLQMNNRHDAQVSTGQSVTAVSA